MCYFVPPPGQLAAELYLEGVARVVVDEKFQQRLRTLSGSLTRASAVFVAILTRAAATRKKTTISVRTAGRHTGTVSKTLVSLPPEFENSRSLSVPSRFGLSRQSSVYSRMTFTVFPLLCSEKY